MIYIHADDYGYSINTSKDILDCIRKGYLDSISIICNNSSFEECMNMLYEEIPSLPFLPLMSVHINLVEGSSVSKCLPMSWGKLFINSLLKNNFLKSEIKKEIKRQIEKTQFCIDKCLTIAKNNSIPCKQKALRLDSHVHTHPIPIVWNCLTEVIAEEEYEIEHIRNPKEPIIPFISSIDLWFSYSLINIIKNRILMLLSKKIDDYCKHQRINKMYLWGLVMSGHMDIHRISKLYKKMWKYSNDRDLVLLFHPGMALDDEYTFEMDKNGFNTSKNRSIEKEAVNKLKDILKY